MNSDDAAGTPTWMVKEGIAMRIYLPDVVIEIGNIHKQEMDALAAYCAELSKLPCYSGDEIPDDPFPDSDTDDPDERQETDDEEIRLAASAHHGVVSRNAKLVDATRKAGKRQAKATGKAARKITRRS
jgi:hypothetical protein